VGRCICRVDFNVALNLRLLLLLMFRMESRFRLLLHEQNLVRSEHPDPRLLSSIEYHKRDLATILGTAKWQVFADEKHTFHFVVLVV
jgi:hypothetical protein